MRRTAFSSLCMLMLITLVVCSGCKQDEQPTNQTNEDFAPYFSAKVNGVEFSPASISVSEEHSVGWIQGKNNTETLWLLFTDDRLKLGTQYYGYKYQQGNTVFAAQYQLLRDNEIVIYGSTLTLPEAGKCTITRLTDKEIEGTFEFTGAADFNGTPTVRVTDGKFRVKRK